MDAVARGGGRRDSREKDAMIGRTPLGMAPVLAVACVTTEGGGAAGKGRPRGGQATPERR